MTTTAKLKPFIARMNTKAAKRLARAESQELANRQRRNKSNRAIRVQP